MVDVSVILIGYNDAERLPNALASIQNQSHSNIEIIAVDDHSTDSSLDVLKRAAEIDSRIRVEQLPSNSGGCSAPRNRGLEIARGSYVMFCDSDDTYDRHAVRNLLGAARKMSADMVVGAAERHISDTGEVKLWWPELHSDEREVGSLAECTDLLYDTISVNKIFRTEFLRSHDIVFPSGLLFEDQLFTLRCYLSAERIGVIPEVVYQWNVARGQEIRSITQSRKELRNLQDRIEINRLMDAELASYPELALAKQVKFLNHEASLYLATIFESDPETARQLASELARYCHEIPLTAYSQLRPGLRIALYYLLVDQFADVINALWWEKGGGIVGWQITNPSDYGDVLGAPTSWWLNAEDLHLPLIPFGRRGYLHKWESGAQISTRDFNGELDDKVRGEIVFVEMKNGAFASIPLIPDSRDGAMIFWRVDFGGLKLIQDRGINPNESGTVMIELTHGDRVNRSPLVDTTGVLSPREISLGSSASVNCANTLVVSANPIGKLEWVATGHARGARAIANKVRRKFSAGFAQRKAPFDVPRDRPVFMYIPAPVPEFPTRMNRFDTQAWIDEFGTQAFLLLPQDHTVPTPKRAAYAYRTYSHAPDRFAQALGVADYLITDSPEFLDDPRAIGFRVDLGAARYLLPTLNVPIIHTQAQLWERVRIALSEYQARVQS